MNKLFLIILAINLAELSQAQTIQSFEFNTHNWILPEGSQIVEFQGEQSLLIKRTSDDALKGYFATLRNYNISDGIIEFDMFCPQPDSISAGFLFRLSNYNEEDRYELFFLNHAGLKDTSVLQYMPVNNNVINWPDYAHDVYRSKGVIQWDDWIHVKAEIETCSATISVNDATIMTVPNLARGRSVGKVGLWLGNSNSCYYSNFKMTVDSIISGIAKDGKRVYTSSVENDQTLPGYVFDENMHTRWSSEWSDPQWIIIELDTIRKVNGAILRWENAYAKAYEILVSEDSLNWTTVYSTSNGNGGTDEIIFDQTNANYVMMYGTTRATGYGYSLWEFEVYDSLELPSSVRDNIVAENLLIIYPNPVSDMITIQTPYSVDHIELYSVSGNKINEYTINHAGSNIKLSVNDLAEGIYFLCIQIDNKLITRKLVIQ